MSEVTRDIHLGDTLTAVSFALVKPDADGIDQPVDLEGKEVRYKIVSKHGKIVVPLTDEGVTIEDADGGQGYFLLDPTAVEQSGEYFAYVVANPVGEEATDTFPVVSREFKLIVHKD